MFYNVDGKMKSSLLVMAVFFLYKTSESLLQPSLRLQIYHLVCALVVNSSTVSEACKNTELEGKIHLHKAFKRDEENQVQITAANYLLAYRILLNLPAVFLCFVCGNLSDRFGRLLPMLIPSVGATLACCFFTASLDPDILPSTTAILVILAGVGVYGCFGKSAVITMACYSYVTDVTPTTQRTKIMGRLMGMNFLGIFLGSFLVGLYQRYLDLYAIIMTVSIANGIITGLVAFLINESHPTMKEITENEKESKTFRKSCQSFTKFWRESFEFIFKQRDGKRRFYLMCLVIACLFNQITKSGEQDLILLYVQHDPLSWSDELYGYYLAVYYACMGLNLVLILPLIERCFKFSDTTLIMVGLLLKSLRLLLTGLFPQTSVLFVAAVLGSAAGFIMSSIKSLISKFVDTDEVGKAFSLVSGIESMSNLIGPALFTSLYILCLHISPGMVFLIDVVIHLCMFIFFLWLHFQFVDSKIEIDKAE